MADRYDAAVVGASVAGCTTATLLARAGARVALIERRPEIDAHKTVCTHYIQASAVETLQALGVTAAIEDAGAVPNSIELYTRAGIVPAGRRHGYNIRRVKLDPMLRRLAAATPGVEMMLGRTVTGLAGGERPTGVEITTRDGSVDRIDAQLVVGADGRGSRVARMAGVRGRVRPHGRFFYWGYYRGLSWPPHPRSRMWVGRDCAYVFPNDEDLTLVLLAPRRERLPEFRADLEGAFAREVESLADGPSLAGAQREGKLIGKLDLPNVARPAAAGGVAFAGDAALASDPLWGVGCGWAIQSGAWLADELAPALAGSDDLDAALRRYRRRHARALGLHHFLIADFSTGRDPNPFETALYRAASRDPRMAEVLDAIGTRSESPATLFRPGNFSRLVRANVAAP